MAVRTNTNQEHNATTPANPKKQRALFKAKEPHSRRSSTDEAGKQQLILTGPTGPRTSEGKRRSRYNAATHGIFTLGVLPRESEEEYHQLVNELVDSLQPAGRLEEVLVEKLAMLLWRYRRLLQAEAAGVTSAARSAENPDPVPESLTALRRIGNYGSIGSSLLMHSAVGLSEVVDSLKELRRRIKQEGLNWERDREILQELYGVRRAEKNAGSSREDEGEKEETEPDLIGVLPNKYRELTRLREATPDADSSVAFPSDPTKLILSMVTEELRTFESILDSWIVRRAGQRELDAIAALVPQQEVADRLQRYEGSLERAFDRTLAQLERLQRMRLGQPVPPALKVHFSA